MENYQLTNFQDLDNYFSRKSMMEIMGVDRDENAHSNFLAWLFENEETGKHACKSLIGLLQQKAEETDKNRKGKEKVIEILDNLANISTEKIGNVKVVREDYICLVDGNTKMEGRCDIVIIVSIDDKKYRIIIENKVKSEEKKSYWKEKKENGWSKCTNKDSIEQTQFYFNYYSQRNDYENIYVFLTLPKKHGPKCNSFFHIDYQKIMDGIIVPAIPYVRNTSTLLKIEDYIKALGINYSQDEVMSVSPELKKLANQLLETNNDVFKNLSNVTEKIIRFWNSKTNTGVANRDILRPFFEVLAIIKKDDSSVVNLLNIINKRRKDGRDGTKYRNIIDDKIEPIDGKNALFRWIVEQYIAKQDKFPSLEKLQLVFPPSLHGKTISAREGSCTNKNIILGESKSDYIKIYKDKEVYICQTGWDGPAMMSRLIKYVKENISQFKDLNIQEVPFFLQK